MADASLLQLVFDIVREELILLLNVHLTSTLLPRFDLLISFGLHDLGSEDVVSAESTRL